MSGMPSFLGSGAECSTGNPLDSLTKQFSKDRSLEQNRFAPGFDPSSAPQQAFRQAFRTQQPSSHPQANQLSNDFIKEFSDPAMGKLKMDPFNFNDLNFQLHQQQLHNHNPNTDAWASEFQHQVPQNQNDPHLAAFNKAFNRFSQPVVNVSAPIQSNFPGKQMMTPQPLIVDPMASAFNQARFYAENSGLYYNQQPVYHQTPRIVEIPNTEQATASPAQQDSTKAAPEVAGTANAETGNIFDSEAAASLEKNWSEEFEKSLDGPLKETFVAGSMEDWEKEFDAKADQIDFGADFANSMSDVDEWAKIYKESISSMINEQDLEWEQRNKSWNDPSKQLYKASDPKFDSYSFYTANPFTNAAPEQLANFIQQAQSDPVSATLSDTILALEASLQKDPLNAELWTLLGIKQQENEREDAAISALRKAISIDSNAVDAYMAIAVSYTNENYYYDAYHSLLSWMSKHPEYSKLVPTDTTAHMENPNTTKDFIQNLYLDAARSRSGNNWDPDVQVGLGVLFNISEEYSKAVDCFRAALSKRPNDYVIWNKLGATMANSQDPKSATEAYFNALELQPSYVRARFNLAVASMNMHHHKEAAEHLLGALSLQKRSIGENSSSGFSGGFVPASSMSKNLWDTLKMLMYMLDEPELAESAVVEDLDAFKHKFEF